MSSLSGLLLCCQLSGKKLKQAVALPALRHYLTATQAPSDSPAAQKGDSYSGQANGVVGQKEESHGQLSSGATAEQLFLAVKIWRLLLAEGAKRAEKKSKGGKDAGAHDDGGQRKKEMKAARQFCAELPGLLPSNGEVGDLFEEERLKLLSHALKVKSDSNSERVFSCFHLVFAEL